MEGSVSNSNLASSGSWSRSGKAPRPHMSAFIDDECDEEEVVGAQPLDEPEGMDEVDSEEYRDQPDVLEYLDQWDMDVTDKISMLRSAANYLTSMAKSQNPELKGRRLK